eukprot:gnl/TRDRNA2_/TRDRNA2_94706_c1_seq1.p1 gnl/TRDRNA2_/TRDRNA2_94706_c1~~gnl/TRDRNA2_/TRDRNA2_94706_c1_seq1.p1  ORF type:complete len:288 (+),score=42.64 gnl/TRDRNA2_/TRDRNA2_94706_c1_seq1:111-974(+)
MAPQKRFEAAHLDLPGFWGEQNSSIDWCERDYVVTYYIAEFWNTTSNVFMCISGILAFVMARRLEMEMRWKVHGLAWAAVGFGSACFHATLWYSGQLLDELPMIYAALVWCYCLLHIWDEARSLILRICLAVYAGVWTVLHSRGAFTTLFQVQYILTVVGGVCLTNRFLHIHSGYGLLSFIMASKGAPSAGIKLLIRLAQVHIGVLILGAVCWVTDQVFCERLHALPINPQFHAWWHVLVALSVHFGFHVSMSAHLAGRRGAIEKVNWAWTFYCLPLVSDVRTSDVD